MMNKGFTLAEILVAMAIIAIVGTILVLIFTNTLRGSNKSQMLAAIKQNGQAVLDSMDRIIRGADNVVCPTSGSSNTIVIVKSGKYSRYRIIPVTDQTNLAPADCDGKGCIILDNPTLLPSDTTLQQFIDRICLVADDMSSAQVLTDTDPLTGISVRNGSFSVSKPPGFKAIATVNFLMGPGSGIPQEVANQIDPVAFQTTIELR